jgi:hypothetical protein
LEESKAIPNPFFLRHELHVAEGRRQFLDTAAAKAVGEDVDWNKIEAIQQIRLPLLEPVSYFGDWSSSDNSESNSDAEEDQVTPKSC